MATTLLDTTEAGTIVQESLGPAMQALTPMQRRYVLALIEPQKPGADGMNGTAAAEAAGYQGDRKKLAEIGSRLRHNPKVVAAIHEEALKHLMGARLLATRVLTEIAGDVTQKGADRLKAADMILNRTGIIEETKSEVVVTHRRDPKEVIGDIVQMAKKLNLDPKQLLGAHGIVIDAEFEVIEVGSTLGLEDIL